MVTTRRSSDITNSAYENGSQRGGIALLERPRSYNEQAVASVSVNTENRDAERERMQKNLDKLMNYDRYSEQQVEEVNEVQNSAIHADEDIRPTSTTMQFGEDIDQIRQEMNKAVATSNDTSYRLNSKGKLAVILYSLAVAVILALIVLNTGVLAKLSNTASARTAELNSTIAQYQAVQSEIADISSDEHIINFAKNEGMVKGN